MPTVRNATSSTCHAAGGSRCRGVSFRDGHLCARRFGTVQHMLFDNGKLEAGESILVQAGGSGIGTTRSRWPRLLARRGFTTVGDNEKIAKAKALGATMIINYGTDRFETAVRKATAKKGVDVRVRDVGPDTFMALCCASNAGAACHLRLDRPAIDPDQPVPALPAAIPHHRLVRCTIRNVLRALPRWRLGSRR